VQAARHLDTGHVRQLQVEYDHVRAGGTRHPQCLRTVGGRRDDVVPGLGEISRDRVAPHRVIIHDHDSGRRVLAHVRTLSRSW